MGTRSQILIFRQIFSFEENPVFVKYHIWTFLAQGPPLGRAKQSSFPLRGTVICFKSGVLNPRSVGQIWHHVIWSSGIPTDLEIWWWGSGGAKCPDPWRAPHPTCWLILTCWPGGGSAIPIRGAGRRWHQACGTQSRCMGAKGGSARAPGTNPNARRQHQPPPPPGGGSVPVWQEGDSAWPQGLILVDGPFLSCVLAPGYSSGPQSWKAEHCCSKCFQPLMAKIS